MLWEYKWIPSSADVSVCMNNDKSVNHNHSLGSQLIVYLGVTVQRDKKQDLEISLSFIWNSKYGGWIHINI